MSVSHSLVIRSVAVLGINQLINIHKSRAMSLYLIKHPLIRQKLIDTKSLHLTYYWPFDRSMSLCIIMGFWTIITPSLRLRLTRSLCWCIATPEKKTFVRTFHGMGMLSVVYMSTDLIKLHWVLLPILINSCSGLGSS